MEKEIFSNYLSKIWLLIFIIYVNYRNWTDIYLGEIYRCSNFKKRALLNKNTIWRANKFKIIYNNASWYKNIDDAKIHLYDNYLNKLPPQKHFRIINLEYFIFRSSLFMIFRLLRIYLKQYRRWKPCFIHDYIN
jgi:hypothetical protein